MVIAAAGLTDLGTVFNIVLAVVLIGGVITGGFFAVKGGGLKQAHEIDKTTIDSLKDQNAVQKQQIEALEATVQALEAMLEKEKAHSAEQDKEIAQLKQLVQGVKAIAVLSETIDRNHQAVMDALGGKR